MLTFIRQKDCSINNLRAVRKRAATLLLLLFSAIITSAQAQTHPYSGVWYMKINTSDFYVVPAANPKITAANHFNEDAYFSINYSSQAGDPEMPFITTYETGGDLNSIWIFVPVTGEDNFYYIIHAKTGKYLKFQPYLTGDNERRKFVHLETIETPGNTEKFEITEYNTGIKIKPKNHAYYLNVAGGNQTRYNGGTNFPYHSGMIGGMSGTDDNSRFILTDASSASVLAPVISDVNETENTFTITSPAAAFSTIRYTTDGSTTPDATTGLTAISGSDIHITAPSWNVQAVGVIGDNITSVAVKTLNAAPCSTPIISFDYITSRASISSATIGTTFYYTTNGETPTTSSTLYEGPFSVTSPTTIKAIATHTTLLTSDVGTFTLT